MPRCPPLSTSVSGSTSARVRNSRRSRPRVFWAANTGRSTFPSRSSPPRFENRDTFYKKLLAQSPVGQAGSDYQKESLLRSLDNAHRLLSSPAAKAFDLSLEPKESVRKYLPEGVDPGMV